MFGLVTLCRTIFIPVQNDSDGDSSAEAAAEAATAALDDLRQLVRDAERERGIDLLESFEHFDRRGQVGKDVGIVSERLCCILRIHIPMCPLT